MSTDRFGDALEGALRGKYARVHTDAGTFEGWVDRVRRDRGSVVLRDATNTTTDESLGSVFVRACDVVEVLKPTRRIEFVALEELSPYPEYDAGFGLDDDVIGQYYRNRFPEGFPVVRDNGTILDGHKRAAAAEAAGLDHLAVEVLSVTDQQAAELFRVAHRAGSDDDADDNDETEAGTEDDSGGDADAGGTDDEDSGVTFGY
ncbi:chromosome partitioning protein ParB [Natronomonas sp.]|uniref:chromosome partitioning protein ParB n=1 Tax=Natronomonas sp. TaxID=2184060 RepID=UPI002621302F|nr:chromosome partitioning protein ParB [Natronomonas sp.]